MPIFLHVLCHKVEMPSENVAVVALFTTLYVDEQIDDSRKFFKCYTSAKCMSFILSREQQPTNVNIVDAPEGEMTELLNGDGPLYIADYLILRIESDVKYSNNMDYAD
ncbi:hypothetical protein M513_07470 [Trichuris suis]|uniref:Uncharacterized protein n=1 Tax=Trichuris suis TaxID=68888 RepID=A0A085M2Z5_9BILA|nr:hypothetical protein M513_07470 [Trichuris suis]